MSFGETRRSTKNVKSLCTRNKEGADKKKGRLGVRRV